MKTITNLLMVYGWCLSEPVRVDVLRDLAKMGSQGVEFVTDEGTNAPDKLIGRNGELRALLDDLNLGVRGSAPRSHGVPLALYA